MKTGLDGMVMDAVNRYAGVTIAVQVDAGAIDGSRYQDLESGNRVKLHNGYFSF
jgi:hypothetical protein